MTARASSPRSSGANGAHTRLSLGAVTLAERAAETTFAEVARQVDASEATIRHDATGRRSPPAARRARYNETLGIAVEAWDRRAPTRPGPDVEAPPAPPPAPPSGARTTAEAELRRTLAELDAIIAAKKSSARVSPGHLASLFGQRTNVIRELRAIENGALGIAEILRSPPWRELVSGLVDVLGKHPAAKRDVEAYLEGLEDA